MTGVRSSRTRVLLEATMVVSTSACARILACRVPDESRYKAFVNTIVNVCSADAGKVAVCLSCTVALKCLFSLQRTGGSGEDAAVRKRQLPVSNAFVKLPS